MTSLPLPPTWHRTCKYIPNVSRVQPKCHMLEELGAELPKTHALGLDCVGKAGMESRRLPQKKHPGGEHAVFFMVQRTCKMDHRRCSHRAFGRNRHAIACTNFELRTDKPGWPSW